MSPAAKNVKDAGASRRVRVPVDLKLKRDTVGSRIQKLRHAKGLRQEDLVKDNFDRGRTTVANWERDVAVPSLNAIEVLADILETTPQYLAFGVTTEPKVVAPDPDTLGYVLVPEVSFDDKGQPVEVQSWGLPTAYLRTEMQVASVGETIIVQSPGDTEKFGFGDRIVVDRATRRVSPPGLFLYWDGQGAMLAHLSLVPAAQKPMVRITNGGQTYEVLLDKMQIIGRVRGVLTRT